MKKLIVSMNLSLDGYFSDENGGMEWHTTKWSGDMGERLTKELSNADTLLLGRRTYEAMASYWPGRAVELLCSRDDIAYAVMMNRYIKFVYSKTLTGTHWQNSQLIHSPLKNEVMGLKKNASGTAKNIMVYGSGMLVKSLMRLNLVDEYQLWLHPTMLGKGKHFFKGTNQNKLLRLCCQEVFRSGVVFLRYEAVRQS